MTFVGNGWGLLVLLKDLSGFRGSQTFLTEGNQDWSTVRTEEYTYDSSLDYLTGVDYNGGLANEARTWTYL